MAGDSDASDQDVRWLTDEESLAWRALIGVVLRLPGVLDGQLRRDSGLSTFEYLVLSFLSMAPGRSSRMSEVAVLAQGSLSRLSNVVKRMEERGWVRRAVDPCDGRYTRAYLTEPGWELVQAAAPGHVAAVRHFVLDPLTVTQVRALTTAGQRILQRIEASDGLPAFVDPDPPC